MYACITDPETGRRLYADLSFRELVSTQCDSSSIGKIDRVNVKDVVTEDEYVNAIIKQLHGVVIKDTDMLKTILHDTFNVSIDTCTELVENVAARLNGDQITEGERWGI